VKTPVPGPSSRTGDCAELISRVIATARDRPEDMIKAVRRESDIRVRKRIVESAIAQLRSTDRK
jgi:hypothetical protein